MGTGYANCITRALKLLMAAKRIGCNEKQAKAFKGQSRSNCAYNEAALSELE